MQFNNYITLPKNFTEWTNLNEGAEHIEIELIKSEATETILYDQEIDL